ncbi:PASTA domain-containing protein [Streptomyces incanus]
MGQQLKIPFVSGMKVGLGFDLLTGSPSSDRVIQDPQTSPPQTGGGQTVTTTFRLVQETNSLQEALGLSAAVSGSYAGFSATAKMQFANQCAVTQYCLYAVLAVEVINSCVTVDAPALVDPDATDLLTPGKTDRFRERFGNRYISGLKSGGEYYAVYRVQSFDEQERTDVAAQISASFYNPALRANLNAAVESMKSTSRNELNVNVFVYSAGGISETETALSEMIEKAHKFPSLVSGGQAIPYQVLLDEYNGLKLPGDNLNFFDQEQQTECLLFNSRLLNDFTTLVNDIDFIRKHLDRFHNPDGSPPDDVALQQARQQCLAIVDQLTRAISDCTRDASTCVHFTQSPEDFTSRLPILREPRPGLQRVPRLIGTKAVISSGLFQFTKNPVVVDLLGEQGFYFIIDNPEVLDFGVLGSDPLPDAGTIVGQTPADGTFVPRGSVLHVRVSPLQENPGPTE